MTDEIQETQTPDEETAPQSASDATAATDKQQTDETSPATDQSQEDQQDDPPKREPWYQKRIDELTRARREAERREKALQAILEQRGSDDPPPADANAQIEARAREMARINAINDAANRTAAEGKKAHADFDAAVYGMQQLGDVTQSPEFLEAVTALPNGHEVYYHLGKNLDEAGYVVSLPPVQMALELAKLSAKLGRPKNVSQAPPPATETVGGTATTSAELSDELPTDEWIKRREAQLANRRS